MKGKVNLHTKKTLSIGFVALLLLSTVMLATPTSAKPVPGGYGGTVYTKPTSVNGSAVGLGNTFKVELWANMSTPCYAYAYWFDWNDTLLSLQSYSVFPPTDIWTGGIFTAEDLLKDLYPVNGKNDRHSYSVSALGTPPGWADDRKIAEYTFKVIYKPAYPEPDMSCALAITDKGFADENENPITMDVEDGTYEIFSLPPLTVGVSADPTTVYSGETSMITVSVTSEGTPVSGAYVDLSSDGGGSFSAVDDLGDGNYTSDFTAPIVSTSTVVNITAEASKSGYVTGEGYANVTVETDVTPPTILILSPENTTYTVSDVSLTFTVSESTSWIGYSLDGEANVTITGNTTLTDLLVGSHHVVVYANDTSGNMGASSAVYFTVIDTTPPSITNVSQTPLANNVHPVDIVRINATVTDDLSGVKMVTLNYTNGNGTWIIVAMTNLIGNIWNATIPAFPYCTNVTYVIIAEDNANNTRTTEEMELQYQYHVIPEFPSAAIMTLLMIIISMLAVVSAKKKLPKKPKT